jgi:hypothetical protein
MRLVWIQDRMGSATTNRAKKAFERVYGEYKTALDAKSDKSPEAQAPIKATQPLQKAPSFLGSIITFRNPTPQDDSNGVRPAPLPKDELTRYLEDFEGEGLMDADGAYVLAWWKV